MYLFLAFIAGIFVVLAMLINARLAERIGLFQGTMFNYIGGLLGAIILVALVDVNAFKNILVLKEVPFVYWLGGLCGIGVVVLSNIVLPRIPVLYTTLLIFTGQLIAGTLIDLFRSGTFMWQKIAGGVLIVLGLVVNMMIDKKAMEQA